MATYHIHHRALGHGLGSGGDDLWMAMTKVRDRVHREEVDVLLPVDIPCFGSLGLDEGYLSRIGMSDWPGVLDGLERTYWVGSETSSYIVVIKLHDLLALLGHIALWVSS